MGGKNLLQRRIRALGFFDPSRRKSQTLKAQKAAVGQEERNAVGGINKGRSLRFLQVPDTESFDMDEFESNQLGMKYPMSKDINVDLEFQTLFESNNNSNSSSRYVRGVTRDGCFQEAERIQTNCRLHFCTRGLPCSTEQRRGY